MSMWMRAIAGSVVLSLMILAPIVPKAQASGEIAGTVTDRTMSVLPGVSVTVTMKNLQRTTVTDSNGRYQFVDLQGGTYTVTAELVGFENAVEENIVVTPGRITTQPFVLHVGCLDEVLAWIWAWHGHCARHTLSFRFGFRPQDRPSAVP